ncbi:MAG: BACON domain-containing protein [Ktedonobacteraceae bacterium]|nr:BACON domain-containing protein [Ktedonobacteraceae bacterium]
MYLDSRARMQTEIPPDSLSTPAAAHRQLPTREAPCEKAAGALINPIEQTVDRLTNAARFIAAVEPGPRRWPHASRLKPLRDISAEIQRHSTPMPKMVGHKKDTWTSTTPAIWLDDEDEEHDENDAWQEGDDPFVARRFPDAAEMQRIEEEDIRRVVLPDMLTAPLVVVKPRRKTPYLRVVFFCLVLLSAIVLVVDGVLFVTTLSRSHVFDSHASSGPPTLTLSASEVSYGQLVSLQLVHFSPTARILLTRDIGERIKTGQGDAPVQVGRDGSARISFSIDTDWTPGFHTIKAEDTVSRYTASASLRVAAGPTRPARLVVNTTTLDFGMGDQGTNTIQPLTLSNAGSGTITWSASSDQPWLLVSPAQGVFSKSQTIEIGVQRGSLKPANYSGRITFSSNVSGSQVVNVQMVVQSLLRNAGAVLAVTPSLLTFTVADGGSNPDAQSLTLSNPGSEPLYWSLQERAPAAGWLHFDQKAGSVPPGGSASIRITVRSEHLLPATYNSTLVFTVSDGHTALNSPQSVGVSLLVLPRCGLTLSDGSLAFTAVAGQSAPANQVLTLAASGNCTNPVNWHATGSAGWLTVAPAAGQLQGTDSAATTVAVNSSSLKPGTYTATIAIVAEKMTQTVMVHLTVQPPPDPAMPVMAASPLTLNFSTTAGQADPPAQMVTITNTGSSPLLWKTAINMLNPLWLGVSPGGGTIQAGQSTQLAVNVSARNLTPGTYVGQIILRGTDALNTSASGSPQTITVVFQVLSPCSLAQPSASSLAFTAVQNDATPISQPLTVNATGNCAWPLTWKVQSGASWLLVESPLTTFMATASSQTNQFVVTLNTTGLAAGSYTTQITITASDANGAQIGSPITVPVSLTITETAVGTL